MRKILTINKKIEFDANLSEVQTSVTRINMNGVNEDVQTKVIPHQSMTICGYNVFTVKFYKKYNIVGKVDGKMFNAILREYNIPILVADSKKYVLSYSDVKGIIARAAFKRIRKDTKVKCSPVKLDLVQVYNCILRNINGAVVYSGWFSKLGQQLQNALLQGDGVNEDADWQKYNKVKGSELKNIQLRFDDDKYSKGYIIVSISSRGFIFTNSIVSETSFFEIVERIIDVLDKEGLIKDAEEEEEVVETLIGGEEE